MQDNKTTRYYSKAVEMDETIPDSQKFQTSLFLSKRTFKDIEMIKTTFAAGASRNSIIETAIRYYVRFIIDGSCTNSLKERMKHE